MARHLWAVAAPSLPCAANLSLNLSIRESTSHERGREKLPRRKQAASAKRSGHRPGAVDRARLPHASCSTPSSIPSGSMEPTLLMATICSSPNSATAIQPLFPSVLAAALLGPHLGWRAEARRRGRLPAAARPGDRLHQAGDRPAGRQDPDDRRPAVHQRRRRSRARRSVRSTTPTHRGRPTRSTSTARRCPNGVSYVTLDLTANAIGDNTRESTWCRPATTS